MDYDAWRETKRERERPGKVDLLFSQRSKWDQRGITALLK